ncbi:hypothetical protein BJY01DRAFT_203932 [Aspergillus pseudoustus]|uniref:Uncharacterized protein n=1 Tax=Aspergillus pseudoustus TaxID=1810923 RepID=A0ABR4KUC2_9EURO
MDLQGQPIPSGQRGVKVTTDPASEQPIREPSGPVVGDSLAAESTHRGGSYAENRGANPLGVTGHNTTTNTTDTSAARKIPSAANAHDREDPTAKERYPDALGGQGEYPGTHVPETGYVGGSTAAKKDLGIGGKQYHASEKLSQSSNKASQSKQQSSGTGARASGSGYQTRSATAAQQKQQQYSTAAAGQGSGKQGDFPSDPKYNASFNSEIGSEDDPGRLAEQKFQRREAETVAGAAAPSQKKGAGDGSWYEPLSSDQRV